MVTIGQVLGCWPRGLSNRFDQYDKIKQRLGKPITNRGKDSWNEGHSRHTSYIYIYTAFSIFSLFPSHSSGQDLGCCLAKHMKVWKGSTYY